MIGLLQNVRKKGKAVYFDKSHFWMSRGAYYMGFRDLPMPNIEYFLSCGIPGQMEGERYIKDTRTREGIFWKDETRPAPATYCVFNPSSNFSKAL